MNIMVCELYLNKAITKKKDCRAVDMYKQMKQKVTFKVS